MSWKMTLLGTLIAVLSLSFGCSKSRLNPEEMKEVDQKLNQTTLSIAIAVKSMWNTEQYFIQEQLTPSKLDLDSWWIALTSTRLNMKRVLEIITTHPSTIQRARNFWAGRVQEYLNQIIDAGLLDSMPGPITSRLDENHGAERVEKEARDVLALTREIEGILDLTRNQASN